MNQHTSHEKIQRAFRATWAPSLLCALYGIMMLSGCATAPKTITAPHTPDVVSVAAPVAKAKIAAGNAREAARQSVIYVDRLIPAPGQEATITALKLSLATTVDELALVETQLDEAQAHIPKLLSDVENMKVWGIGQQVRADALHEREIAERTRADKEHAKAIKAGRERDIFVGLFSLGAALIALMAVKPVIGKVALIPVYGQIASIAVLVVAPVAAFFAAFILIRFVVARLVNITF